MEAKIVFITGASSGIGEGCARKFAKEGWNLILNARTVSKLEELKTELEATHGVRVYTLPFDVRDRKLAAASLESLPEEWKAIDVLVNNAGLVIGVDKEFEGSLDEWDIMIDTNIRGLLAMTRLVVPGMVERLQSVISEEIKKQLMEKEGRESPDYLIACIGGGSNAAGTIYHYVDDRQVQIVLAEAGGKGIETGMTAATIALGKLGIIHGARTYVIQNEDGQIEEPYSISAGLDYPGIGPMHANLAAQKRAIVLSVNDDEAIRAAYELTKLEGIIPALESAHALGALKKLNFKTDDVVVLTVSGRGDKDVETYLMYKE